MLFARRVRVFRAHDQKKAPLYVAIAPGTCLSLISQYLASSITSHYRGVSIFVIFRDAIIILPTAKRIYDLSRCSRKNESRYQIRRGKTVSALKQIAFGE